MKPTESDIKYCLEHKEDIARWLEQRGGWQIGDWCDRRLTGVPALVVEVKDGAPYLIETIGRGRGTFFPMGNWDIVWLPTTDDVLEMLGAEKLEMHRFLYQDGCLFKARGWFGKQTPAGPISYKGVGETRLIALMELLKAVENE